MDTLKLDRIRLIIENILSEYAQVPYAYGNIKTEIVFDRTNDRYLLVNVGWDLERRIHGCLIHIDIIEDKIWIQRDGTEEGIADELEKAGIPKDKIVLGFRPPEVRQYTGYAVA
ncbi:MAG: XisI protein [Gomphosphaeria aponina SAG 52.96 = DSM 107014]|uniref:XisI protein n=1 Tax=Gomphosphaeria aponina SAG 52.96 = DSM 107014 TaxID=1521640 RepID=A0A941GSA7_9CHRO|nr:XisI protein [Gomphosphaeria aponina SAG 52.96 = DSM 107014]